MIKFQSCKTFKEPRQGDSGDRSLCDPGAGAEVRSATGITVFAGMIGVTLFGLFLTPVFYVGLRTLSGRKLISHGETTAPGALGSAYSQVDAVPPA